MKVLVEQKLVPCNLFLYFSAFTANLITFSSGASYVWSSPAIPRLNGQIDPDNNPLNHNITAQEESWIASCLPLAAAISSFLSGYLSDRIGRKNTLLLSGIPPIIAYIFLTFANKTYYIYIGRFLCGLSTGATLTIMPIYIGEIAQSNNRGFLGCLLVFYLAVGCLYIYFISPVVTLQILSALNIIIPIVFLILFGLFVPESPYYYVIKNRIDLAEKSLLKFRYNSKEIVCRELPIIIKDVQASFSKKISFKDMIKEEAVRKGAIVSIGLMVFQQWSGINAVFFYMQSIFEDTKVGISSDNCVIIAGMIQLLTSMCILPTVDRFGRRILLLASSIGNASSLCVGGIYLYLQENTAVDVTRLSWLPFITINLFVLTYTVGMGPVSFTMIGELFPPHVKSLAATANIFVCLLSTFLVTNIFPYMKESFGLGVSFIVLAVICCISSVFIYFKVPETKGRRLEEIQDVLLSRK
ncbi:sugar transporter-like [Holotrichia oblita]|uniref:Sugar transporter-like n=2 Tax=Holotrichia oblita TaxID=644536 RepID=A0ACB9SLS3_HOLOL|nr:sugar transporter-like [Holotrichia oblita]KAI4455947.1 sugar transporter-like [Holotrichia oblita]